MQITPLSDNIFYLEPESMANYQACAGLLIEAELKITIDPNLGPDHTGKFLDSQRPDMAFVTHFHLDHSAWVNTAAGMGIIVCVPEAERLILGNLDCLMEATARPCGLESLWRRFVTDSLGFQPLDSATTYHPGILSRLSRVRIEVLATPGHSPGHCSFWFPESGILFCGDMGLDRFGPWYGWHNCDLAAMVESICRLRAMDVRLLVTSHGGIIRKNPAAAWDRALDKIEQREKRIIAGLEKGLSKERLIEEGIFFTHKDKVDEPLKTFFYMWDAIMLDHHLRLIADGGLRRLTGSLNFKSNAGRPSKADQQPAGA